MEASKGKIILFGKTGEGKSTAANALVTGGIEHLKFEIGHGLRGCTSEIRTLQGRGWTVTDTVGLGEGDGGQVSNEVAEEKILDFLKSVKGEYTHVIYVKSSSNRFDVLDDTIWKTFKRIFKGAEGAFTLLFTKGNEKWLDDNWKNLPKWVHDLERENVLITDIPPVSDKKVRESRNKETRILAIEKLEGRLLEIFEGRGGKYAVPDISKMDNASLRDESRSILVYIRAAISMMKGSVTALASVASAVPSLATILTVFGLAP